MNKKDIINSMMPEAQYGTYKKEDTGIQDSQPATTLTLQPLQSLQGLQNVQSVQSTQAVQAPTLTPLEQWHDNYEVMEMFHISQRTLQALRSNGKLPFAKMGGRCYYKESDLQRLMEESYRDSRVKPMPKDKVMPKVEQPAKEGGTPCQ